MCNTFNNIVIQIMFEYELVLVMIITQKVKNEKEYKLHLYNKSCFSKLIIHLAVLQINFYENNVKCFLKKSIP